MSPRHPIVTLLRLRYDEGYSSVIRPVREPVPTPAGREVVTMYYDQDDDRDDDQDDDQDDDEAASDDSESDGEDD